ncbi:hypothetical protein LAWI1_G004695 [Lachnellula willkommii]|uniref:Fungal N-terminal domain-containing protein n=1 Tax=Lachnellula willkommii TaxID=215461 RepID=A0A559ME81_9HELO|nr:hypothetical protein LAWI1_G004695 [Lachnellula willkommii]
MSGLEVLAAVTSIVFAFNGSLSLYRSWRDKRTDRVADEENHQLEYSLYIGATTIQQEYERYSTRLGPRFSSGDDDCQSQLAQYITYFQYTIETLTAESQTRGMQLPSLANILAVSEATRIGVVGILEEQYQRMAQGGSASRAFLSPSHRSALRGSVACEAQRDVVRRGATPTYGAEWSGSS